MAYYSMSPMVRSRSSTPAYMDVWNSGGAGGQSIMPRITSPNMASNTTKVINTSNTRTYYNPAT